MQEEISFGNWLRKQRRALDLTRQVFADQVGCAEVTLRRIEAGTLKPSKELTQSILEKLGIPKTEWSLWISFARGLSGFPFSSSPLANRPISNLPAPITTFIGREKEQSNVIRLNTKYRLVTLTGVGGVGKTRLAIRVGKQVLGNYADGVWFVEFAPILDLLLVPHVTAIAIGLHEEPQRPIIDMLSDYLREKKILIILDNCEHLLNACAQLADTLLKHCPGLKILATSREALGILGEAVYPVPSLEVPDIQQLLIKFRDYESVRLFEERAQLARMDFSLTIENASSVATICRRLDGIPLAIELAAARVNMFSTEQIAARLQESSNLLTTGNRAALPRHQTLHTAIDWSYNLLSDAERALFGRLSVFIGGWTLEAAESVCEGDSVKSEDVLNLLGQLINKSLVIQEEAEQETRYHMLETIRQYAHERLLEAAESDLLRDKHLAYFVKLVEKATPELYRSNQVLWLNKLDDELDNLRMALDWGLAADVELGLRLIVSARFFWEARGDMREVEGWLEQLLENYKEADSLCARALVIYSKILSDRGVFAEAQEIANQSLEIALAISDKQAEAFSLWGLGASLGYQGDVRQGIPLIKQSLALYQFLGDKLGQATALDWLSMDHNDWERSKAYIVESLRLYRELGHLSGIALCLMDLAEIMIAGGNFSSLRPLLEEARTIYRQLESPAGEAYVLMFYGRLAFWQGDYSQAGTYFEQSILLYEKVGASWSAWSRVHLAYALLRQGDVVQARETFEISLQQFEKAGYINGLICTIEGFASWHVNQGQSEHATQLFAWADIMREKMDDDRPPVEQKSVERDLAVIHTKLDEAEFAKFSEEGRAMTLEQAVALALQPV
jgi:predicted ATPase/DNA-binding XRE family transcriptional regulator